MKIFLRAGFGIFAAACLAALSAVPAFAQNKPPNIAYVYPGGAQRGAKTKILLGGKDFKDASAAFVSGEGVSAKITRITIPEDNGKLVSLRNQFEKKYIEDNPEIGEELKKASESDVPGALWKVRKKIREGFMSIPENVRIFREASESYYLRYVSSEPMAETVEIELDISGDAKLGERDIKILTPAGLSNSMKFHIGSLPEFSKKSLREDARERVKQPQYWSGNNLKTWKDTNFIVPDAPEIFDVEIPAFVNGQIVEGKTDFYRFKAKKGQKIVAAVWAQSLIPYISDAVPGWFQTVLILRDEKGAEIAYNDDFGHRPDSLIVAEIPADGKYVLEIRDAIYRSREDFVYRILLGEVPFVESVFPLGFNIANASENASGGGAPEGAFEMHGVNLDRKSVVLKGGKFGSLEFSADGCFSKNIPLSGRGMGTAMSMSETSGGKGSTAENPQRLKLPALVDGRIAAAGASDYYKFYLSEGEKVEMEIFARRLDSPLDSALELRDSSGKIVATADDFEDPSCGLVTHHADSRLVFEPKESGQYSLRVFDARGEGSPSHSYRLKVGRPSPDFKLRAEPANINIRPGEIVSVRVVAFRKNGMDEPIELSVEGLPKGFKVYNGEIARGEDSAQLMLAAPDKISPRIRNIKIAGRAKVGARTLKRMAVPCQDMMQAFYYMHLVPCSEMSLSVNAPSGFARGYSHLRFMPEKIVQPVCVPESGSVRVAVGQMKGSANKPIAAAFLENVDGLKIVRAYTDGPNRMVYVELERDAAKIKPGAKGKFSLAFRGRAKRDFIDICKIPPVDFVVASKEQMDDFKKRQWAWVSEVSPKVRAQKKAAEAKRAKRAEKNSAEQKPAPKA